jgi:hypothetical protein
MTIMIPPGKIGIVLDLSTFESIYINYENNSICGKFNHQEHQIFDFHEMGITFSPSKYEYKVTSSVMGLIIQSKLK